MINWNFASTISLLLLTTSSHASIINTLNGIDYEWLELSETQGMSRLQVEDKFNDTSSALFGYQYASRQLVSELFFSYAPWDGLSGMHGDPAVVSGLNRLIKDFGVTQYVAGDGINTTRTTVDGYTVLFDSFQFQSAIYGERGECVSDGTDRRTCVSSVYGWFDKDGAVTAVYQDQQAGWNPLTLPAPWSYDRADDRIASYLVRAIPAPVPLPATFWLFGSGLIALFGAINRKTKNRNS